MFSASSSRLLSPPRTACYNDYVMSTAPLRLQNLPVELIERIIALAGEDDDGSLEALVVRRRSLRSLSLVCSAWRPSAQRELVRVVCITCGPEAVAFAAAAATRPNVVAAVHRLVLTPARTVQPVQSSHLDRQMRYTSTVTDLDLGPTLQPEHVAAVVPLCAATLTTLELTKIDIIPSSIFEHLRSLRDLVLNACSFHLPYPSMSFSLNRLFIANHSLIVLRHQIAAFQDSLSGSLQHLALYHDYEIASPWHSTPVKIELDSRRSRHATALARNPQIFVRIERVLAPAVPHLKSIRFDASFLAMFAGLLDTSGAILSAEADDRLFEWHASSTATYSGC